MKILSESYLTTPNPCSPGTASTKNTNRSGTHQDLFLSALPKNTVMPFIRDHLDLKRYMSIVILALLPVTFFGFYNTGYQAAVASGQPASFFPCFFSGLWTVLPIIIVSYAVGFFWEFLFAIIRGA